MVRGDRRSEEKRREILSAARALFVTEGYADTGMEVVARRAAVSTATLYAYFPSKAHLFRTTVEELIGANPITRAVLRMVAAERRRFNDSAETLQARTRHEIGAAVIQMISELTERGELQVERPSWAASQLLGLIEHPTLLYGLVNGDDASARRTPDIIAEEAVNTFLARYGVRERAG